MIERALFVASCLLLCSCASMSVKKTEYLSAQMPRHVPARILVRPLAFYEPALNVDRSGEKLADFRFNFQERLTAHLLEELPLYVAPAQPIAANAPLPRGNYWVISGQFDQVTQGSRLLRTVVGFGLGGSQLATTIVVTDLSGPTPRQFLRIQTTGGSNATPPLMGFFRSGLGFDENRTAHQIAAAISEYLYQQGVFPEGMAIGPKRTGDSASIPYLGNDGSAPLAN